jgi:hypothetical protein
MDLFDTLIFAEILVRTTFLGTLSLNVPWRNVTKHFFVPRARFNLEGILLEPPYKVK